jgi:superfamily II DNA or RNA helicase
MFKWLEETPGAVCISSLLKEGVSLPALRAGIIADHIVGFEVMSQIIGRFIRRKKTGKNECEIVMFIDRQHPRLRSNSLKLLDKLQSVRGYDFYCPLHGPDTMEMAKLYKSAF